MHEVLISLGFRQDTQNPRSPFTYVKKIESSRGAGAYNLVVRKRIADLNISYFDFSKNGVRFTVAVTAEEIQAVMKVVNNFTTNE